MNYRTIDDIINKYPDKSSIKRKINDYIEIIISENKKRNITGYKSKDEIINKGILVSLNISGFIRGNKGIDIGSGNGFPGIITAIVYPEKDITLLDSNKGKCSFLEHVKNELSLGNITVINNRSEIISRDNNYREKYNFASSRAVSSLKNTIEMSAALIKTNGYLYTTKGEKFAHEIKEAEDILRAVNCTLAKKEENIIIFKKNAMTPNEYPRNWKKIITS